MKMDALSILLGCALYLQTIQTTVLTTRLVMADTFPNQEAALAHDITSGIAPA